MIPNKFAAQQLSKIRKIMMLAILFALIGSALPHSSHAQSGWTPVNGTITIINDSAGDQVRPHISGDLVTYTSVIGGNSQVHYYNFLTGTDAAIPQGNSLDYLADVNDSTIVYTQVTSNSYAINEFDTSAGGAPITLDPQPNSQRELPSIGGQTVVWVDFGLQENPYISDLVVYDRVSGIKTRLTDDPSYDTSPSVSPDGSLIVWAKCEFYSSGCHVWQASFNGAGWDVMPIAGSGEQTNPATDGQYIVYSGYLNNNTTDLNIFWQVRDSNEEHEILIPGNQRNPSIDRGVVVFESSDAANPYRNWDALVYDIESATGYQVANHAEMSDISVSPDGTVRVVWFQYNVATDCDIYASTFRLPDTDNQPPVIDQITAPLDPVEVGATVLASASFSDPNSADTHTAVWDWGDGSTSLGMVDETSGTGTASGNHTYTTPGVYLLALTITDDQDASATVTFQYVVVYDPVGGFVTGSGWIDSPAGAYTHNPDLTGRAHFGFVSRYQKGAGLPSGQTEFQFKAGDLSFRSTAYDWLVVAGAKAQFKGSGAINGSGDYGFLLSVTDDQLNGGGNVDKFRIKIWDRSSGEVIYDNQVGADETADPSTAIGGGSIVIHK